MSSYAIQPVHPGSGEQLRDMERRIRRHDPGAHVSLHAAVGYAAADAPAALWQARAEELAHGDGYVTAVAAAPDGRSLGIVIARHRGNRMSIQELWVDPAERGRRADGGPKIVDALLDHVEQAAVARGAEWLTLVVGGDQVPAMRAYERRGFSTKDDPNNDDILTIDMTKPVVRRPNRASGLVVQAVMRGGPPAPTRGRPRPQSRLRGVG